MLVTFPWWAGLALAVAGLLAIDLVTHRRAHVPGTAEAARWVGFFCACALGFAGVVWAGFGAGFGGQFLAGWLTEYSLSVDNLFVFMVLMARFSVPDHLQMRVLTIGIVLALVMRACLIAIGSVALARFSWLFLIFGAFLIWTAWGLVRSGGGHKAGPQRAAPGEVTQSRRDSRLATWAQRRLPMTRQWHGARLWSHEGGRFVFTPLLLTMVALGVTDLLFALDSIPAIFGMTREPFLVIAANAFALLGLRQLYFLVGGLVDRLVHLSKGLSFVLAFIGLKLVLEALHENRLGWLNGGRPVDWAPQIPVWVSLGVVAAALAVTTVASLVTTRRRGSEDGKPDRPAGPPAARPAGQPPAGARLLR